MGYIREKTGIDLNPINAIERVVGVVGRVLEPISKAVGDVLSFAGGIIQNALDNPLETIITIGASMIGIPPYVTSAAITAAKGGSLEDIAKSAAISYATTEIMSSTQIGQDIRNYTSNQIAGDFTDSMMETFQLTPDQAVSVAKISTAALNSSITGGIRSALNGTSVLDGMASGFTSGLVYSSTDSYFDSVNKDLNWGLNPTALNLVKGATSTALNTIISGKGDPAQAVGNYIAYASFNLATSPIKDAATTAYNNLKNSVANVVKAQDAYTPLKSEHDEQVSKYTSLQLDVKTAADNYETQYQTSYVPFKSSLDALVKTNSTASDSYTKNIADYKKFKSEYDEWDRFYEGEQIGTGEDSYWTNPIPPYTKQSVADRANAAAASANKNYDILKSTSDDANKLVTDNKATIDSLGALSKTVEDKSAAAKVIYDDIAAPSGNNLAQQLKDSADNYQTAYTRYEDAQANADTKAENFTKQLTEVATRDATIEALNSGALTVVSADANGYKLSNGMVLNNAGKFLQNGQEVFTNASGVSQKPLDFSDNAGNKVDFSPDAGRIMSTTDVQNAMRRDYNTVVSDTEAKKLAGNPLNSANTKEMAEIAEAKKGSLYFDGGNRDAGAVIGVNGYTGQKDSYGYLLPLGTTFSNGVTYVGGGTFIDPSGKKTIAGAGTWNNNPDNLLPNILSSGVTITGTVPTDINSLLSIGDSAKPPENGGGSIFGSGSGSQAGPQIGIPTFIAKDDASQASLSLTSNGYALLTYSDGHSVAINPKTQEVIWLDPIDSKKVLEPAVSPETKEIYKTVAEQVDKAEEEKVIADKIAKDKEAVDKLAEEKKIADKAAADKLAADKVIIDKAAVDAAKKAHDDQVAADAKAAVDRQAVIDKAAADAKIANDAAALKTAQDAQKALDDKIVKDAQDAKARQDVIDKAQADAKTAADKVAADKVVSDKAAADKAAADKVVADKAAADKIVADKVAADKAVADAKAAQDANNAKIAKDAQDAKDRQAVIDKAAADAKVANDAAAAKEAQDAQTALNAKIAKDAQDAKDRQTVIDKSIADAKIVSDKVTADAKAASDAQTKSLADATKTAIDTAKADLTKSIGDLSNKTTTDMTAVNKAITDLQAAGLTTAQVKTLVDAGTANVSIDLKATIGAASTAQSTALDNAKAALNKSISDLSTKTTTDTAALNKSIADLKAAGLTPAQVKTLVDAGSANVSSDLKATIAAASATSATALDAAKAGLTKSISDLSNKTTTDMTALNKSIADLKAAGLTADQVKSLVNTGTANVAAELKASIATAANTAATQIAGVSADLKTLESKFSSEIKAAVASGLTGDAALNKAIAAVATDQKTDSATLLKQLGTTEAALKTQFATQISGLDTKFAAAIADAKASGLAGDAALLAAINAVAANEKTDSANLLKQIGTTEANLKNQFATQLGGVQADLAKTKTDILAEVTKNEAAGLTRDAALQKAISTVAANQKTDADSLLAQLGTTAAALNAQFVTQVAGLDTKLSTAIAEAKASGLKGDAALQAAINKVATDQQTTATNILAQMGKSEADLKNQFSSQISGLAADVQAKYDALSQAQKDAVNSQVQQGKDLTLAITESAAGLQTQITGLTADVQAKYDAMSATQKADVAALKAQGQNTQDAIATVAAATQTQIAGVAATFQEKLNASDQATKDQFNKLTDAQKATAQQLETSTGNLQTAITQAGTKTQEQISGVQAQFNARVDQLVTQGATYQAATDTALKELSAGSASIKAEQEAAKTLAAENLAAQKKATAQSGTNAALAGAMSLLGGAVPGLKALATTPVTDDSIPAYKKIGFTSTGETAKYVSPLEQYMKQVMGDSYTNPQPRADNMNPEQQQQPSSPWSYGQETNIDSLLASSTLPEMGDYQTSLYSSKKGGLVPPLMATGGSTRHGKYAGGGLNTVNFEGKNRIDFRSGNAVSGAGDGQSDDIPAMLADGEFVFPADVVSALGNGSTKAGSDKLYDMMHSIRSHSRSSAPKELPPAAKSPLDYLNSPKRARR